jgi:hypothetical protein
VLFNHFGFTKVEQIRNGAFLSTIAHAIWIAQNNALLNEVSWDGPNYSRQDTMGTRGTITFADSGIVGVLRDDHSPRCPWGEGRDYKLNAFFEGIPPDLKALAESKALQYVLDEFNGIVSPIITTAFWSEGDEITAAEPWVLVLEHGAHIIETELLEFPSAIRELASDYEFSTTQVELLETLYREKISTPNGPIVPSSSFLDMLRSTGSEGLDKALRLLSAINIIKP